MEKRRILIVEDRDLQRQVLHEELERRGFGVWSAKDVATARKYGRELGESLDVAVLDMRLEDPAALGITGADIGIEIRKEQKGWPSEFLVISAYPDVDYYQHALRLGAAAYLHKPQEPEEVFRQIRALALRRAVAQEAPEDSMKVRRIAEASNSRVEAVSRYCRDILSEYMEATLGPPFILLLSDSSGTRSCGGPLDDSGAAQASFLHTVAGIAFGNASAAEPFTVAPGRFPEPSSAEEESLLDQLDGAAIVSLAETRDFRLSLGILHEDLDSNPLAENASLLAARVVHYAQTTVATQLLGVATIWAELNARRRAMLAATSRFCLYVGQEQVTILDLARANRDVNEDAPAVVQLQDLGEDLYNAGNRLADLYEQAFIGTPGTLAKTRSVQARALVKRVWKDLAKPAGLEPKLLDLRGDCTIQGDMESLYFAIYRILEWLVERLQNSPGPRKPIQVECAQGSDCTQVSFAEDTSRRLPGELREQLFLPFSEASRYTPRPGEPMKELGHFFPLYLAKTFVELESGGHFEDRSEEIEGQVGHCFVMSFGETAGRDAVAP